MSKRSTSSLREEPRPEAESFTAARGKEEAESEEEDDYLRMDLTVLEEEGGRKKEKTYREKRQETLNRHLEGGRVKPLQEREAEVRTAGLEVAVGEGSKGMSLLKRMGYMEGEALGKNREGIKIPLPIVMREGRMGVGHAPETDSKRRSMEKDDDTEAVELDAEEFRARSKARVTLRRIAYEIRLARQAIERLDTAKGIESEYWLPKPKAPSVHEDEKDGWSYSSVVQDEEEEEGKPSAFDQLPDEEKLELVVDYLRKHYHYCIWCGEAYDSKEEMERQCPGPTYEDHEG